MRLSRAKAIRKHLRFYRIVYGIVPPYQVVLDGNFIHMALRVKMDIKDRLKKLLLGSEPVLFVPRGVLSELRALGEPCRAALEWAEACCQVLGEEDEEEGGAMGGTEAIKAAIGEENSGRYMVATQDAELRAELRAVPSVALLFVNRAVLLMEPPSASSKAASTKLEKEKWRQLEEEERALVEQVRQQAVAERRRAAARQAADEARAAGQVRPKKKRAKGPNPLSVMKKKTQHEGSSKGGAGGGEQEKKRKRKHKNHNKPQQHPPAPAGTSSDKKAA